MSPSNKAKLAADLEGFWERQQLRARKRREYMQAYLQQPLPLRANRRSWQSIHLSPQRDIYPAVRTPEVHTRIARVRG